MSALNDKQMPHEIKFSLLRLSDEIQNTKKKERKFEKKVREIW